MRRFADAYFTTLDVMESLAIAGYTGNYDALRKQGYRLLNDDRVQAYLQQRRESLVEKTDGTLLEILGELKAIAFADITQIASWTETDVTFKPSAELDRGTAKAVKRIKARKRSVTNQQGEVVGESIDFELDLHNKETALKTLATYYGIDSDWNTLVTGLARFGLVLKEDQSQPSGWRVDRLEK